MEAERDAALETRVSGGDGDGGGSSTAVISDSNIEKHPSLDHTGVIPSLTVTLRYYVMAKLIGLCLKSRRVPVTLAPVTVSQPRRPPSHSQSVKNVPAELRNVAIAAVVRHKGKSGGGVVKHRSKRRLQRPAGRRHKGAG